MPSDLDLVADAVSRGEIVLFLGAGVHASPDPRLGLPWQYPDADRPLFAGELAEKLASDSGWSVRFDPAKYPPGKNFTRVTLDYELNIENDRAQKDSALVPLSCYPVASKNAAIDLRTKGRTQLANVVRAAVSVKKKPSPALRGLAQLNFPIIVTTNYDSLFRDALIEAGKSPITEYYIPGRPGKDIDPSDDPTSQKPFLFKIHGCESNASSMVLTDEDYIDFVLGMSEKEGMNPVPRTIFYRMSKWPTLFIGYSLQDYNLRLLLKTLRQGKDRFKTCYAIDPYPDSLITRVWDDELEYVSFVAQDLWTFVPALYKKVKGQDMPP
jgi:SIR2-like domain